MVHPPKGIIAHVPPSRDGGEWGVMLPFATTSDLPTLRAKVTIGYWGDIVRVNYVVAVIANHLHDQHARPVLLA